jgi:tetratricopeptide (TPR) repeat protein
MNTRPAFACAVVWLSAAFCCFPSAYAQANPDFAQGLSDFRAGNYSSAVTSFNHAEAASPGTTDALLYEAKCHIHLNQFAEAEKALRSYLPAHPNSADAAYLLGFVLHRENHPADSLAVYTQAAAIARPTSDDLKIVGLDYILLGDYPDATRWLEKSVEFDPKNKDAWYYLGRTYYSASRLSDARKAFLSLLSLDPHDVRAENNLGLIFETEGQSAQAAEAYRQSIAWQKESLNVTEQPYVNLGSLLMEQGQIKEAFEPLQKAAEIAPGNAYCRLKLGIYFHKIGQLENAQRELEKATQLEPENAAAHYQLGRLYKDMRATDRAQTEFDRAEELQTKAAGSRSSLPNH